MDENTKISELKEMIKEFCEERDWDQFHDAKELAIGLSTESNELLQLFRFKNKRQIDDMFADENIKAMIEDEISDVLYFALRFAQVYNIDLSSSLKKKIIKNNNNYPVETSKGNNKKYNEGKI